MGVDWEGLTLYDIQLTTNQIKAGLNNRCYPGAIVIYATGVEMSSTYAESIMLCEWM